MSAGGGRLSCAQAAEQLYAYLDRELTAEVERAIAAHLSDCANCFGHFEFERAFLAFVARRGGSGTAPDELRERILRSVRGRASPEAG
mgnify:CR=1 FL=1